MGRMYSAVFEGIVQSAGDAGPDDILQIQAPSAMSVVIHSIFYGHGGATESVGDANADMGSVVLYRAGSAGSGGTSVSANPLNPGDAADSSTILRHNSSEASSLTALVAETFHWQAGWYYKPTPEERIVLGGSDVLVMVLEDTVAATMSTSCTMIFEEIG